MAALTVSMPYRGGPERLRKAVTSILGQTYRDLQLIVVNDGDDPQTVWHPIADIHDPRLIRFDLPPLRPDQSHGRYFADAVVAYAVDTEWFTCHDADDWSEPNRYQTMFRHARPDVHVVPGGEQIHSMNGRQLRYRRPLTRLPNPRQMRTPIPHMWHISAVYRTGVFRQVIHPGFRVGWDSLMSAMLHTAPDVRVIPSNAVHYHRVAREGSLTRHPDTGVDSAFRRRTIRTLAGLWDRYQKYGPGLDTVGRIIGESTTDPTWEYLNDYAAKLAAICRR